MCGSNNFLSWFTTWSSLRAGIHSWYDSYLDIFSSSFRLKWRVWSSLFSCHSIHFSYHTRWIFVENQNMPNSVIVENSVTFYSKWNIYARTESRTAKKHNVVYLNINVVTTKLRWNLGSVYQITEATVNHSKYHVVFFFIYLFYFVRCSCEPESMMKWKQHVEKIHTVHVVHCVIIWRGKNVIWLYWFDQSIWWMQKWRKQNVIIRTLVHPSEMLWLYNEHE